MGDDGPEKWFIKYANCASSHQSPIAIWLDDLKIRPYSDKNEGIQLNQFDNQIRNATILNNGHTVLIKITSENHLTFTSGHLPDKYKLVQMHFHWGQHEENVGSEHTIGNGQYPLELHLVHVNEETDRPEAVLGIFYQLVESDESEDDNSSFINPSMNAIVKNFYQVHSSRKLGFISDALRISDLLPKNIDDFIYYNGSLTTPPCTEGIHWTIFRNVQSITKHQLELFRLLRGQDEDEYLGDNFRPTQPLNNRIVTLYTYQPSSKSSNAFSASYSLFPVLILSLTLTKIMKW